VLLLALLACDRPSAQQQRGRALIAAYGCGACHEVPDVRQATGRTGPPLDAFGRRVLIAGNLPNSPGNLQRWIMSPQVFEPGTAMPDLDVEPEEAAAMAAYLLSLR
jgi:cytochrome c1